jgi:homocysteine S-methyltransferase
MPDFRELLADGRPHLFDGAMGTMLYAKGVYINRCYDELCVSQPEMVADVHRAYVRAGAEVIETNSYGANRLKLARHGLEERTHEINVLAARIAREAAGDRVHVAGAMGPLGVRIEPFGPTSQDEARALFSEQAAALVEGGVDLFILETFSDLEEIHQAMLAIRELCDLPVVAQITIREDGRTPYGTEAALAAERLSRVGRGRGGAQLQRGPSAMLAAPTRCSRPAASPSSCSPTPASPRDVDGRTIYMASPEYMATYAARLIRKGVRFVGGCCGTTPSTCRAMAGRAAHAGPAQSRASRRRARERSPRVEPVPLAERSEWGRKLAAGEFLTTVEIVPPRGVNPARCSPACAPQGSGRGRRERAGRPARASRGWARWRRRSSSSSRWGWRRWSTTPAATATCLGMLSDLLGAQALGVRNMLFVTGDPPKMGPYPDATAVFDIDAIGLTNLAARLNQGLDPGGNVMGDPTSFVLGVGVNPGRRTWSTSCGASTGRWRRGRSTPSPSPCSTCGSSRRSWSGSSARGSASRSWRGSGPWSPRATPSSSPTRSPASSSPPRSSSGCAAPAPRGRKPAWRRES